MSLPENKHLRFILILLYTALGSLAAYFIFKYVFKWMLPFVIALIVASLLKKPTAFLSNKLRLKRSFISVIMVVFVYGVVGTSAGLLISYIIGQIRAFLSVLPDYLSSIPQVTEDLWNRIIELLEFLPDNITDNILNFIETSMTNMSLSTVDFGSVFGTVKSVAFSIPSILIFTIAMLVSTFYFLSDYDRIMIFIKTQIPERGVESVIRLKNHMIHTMGKWFRAMGIIILITFSELLIGFLILRIDYPVILAAIIALIDALPVFGTGTILIPWAIYLLLVGNYRMAFSITLIYIIITLIRNVIEPRILGDHIGLNPLVMLICFYLGFVTLGLMGMFILPLLIVCADKLQEWGYIKLWRQPEPVPAGPLTEKRRWFRLKHGKKD